jgi:hypothetical protein
MAEREVVPDEARDQGSDAKPSTGERSHPQDRKRSGGPVRPETPKR